MHRRPRAVEVGRSGSPQRCSYETSSGGNRPAADEPRRVGAALYVTRGRTRVAAYLAEERRRDPHLVVKERPLR